MRKKNRKKVEIYTYACEKMGKNGLYTNTCKARGKNGKKVEIYTHTCEAMEKLYAGLGEKKGKKSGKKEKKRRDL